MSTIVLNHLKSITVSIRVYFIETFIEIKMNIGSSKNNMNISILELKILPEMERNCFISYCIWCKDYFISLEVKSV